MLHKEESGVTDGRRLSLKWSSIYWLKGSWKYKGTNLFLILVKNSDLLTSFVYSIELILFVR